jgi:hypothetical protein
MSENRKSLIPPSETAREIAVNEAQRSKKEMLDTREKLGEFTLRDFAEGLYGEDFAHIVYGAEGGSIKMNDLKFKMNGNATEGEAVMKLDEEQMVGIMMESHPSLTRSEALLMLTTNTPEANQQIALQYLSEHEETVEDAADDAHKRFRDGMMKAMGKDVEE